MLIFRAGTKEMHAKMLQIAQTIFRLLLKKQSKYGLYYFPRPFFCSQLVFEIVELLSYFFNKRPIFVANKCLKL